MKRILAMTVLLGLGIFLSIQVAQAGDDDNDSAGANSTYQYEGSADSGAQVDTGSDASYDNQSNSERIQDILDSRAQAREEGTNWSQSWVEERGFTNDSSMSEPMRSSEPIISEPVRIEPPAAVEPSYDTGITSHIESATEQNQSSYAGTAQTSADNIPQARGSIDSEEEIVVVAPRSNSERIQDILDSRAQAREEGTNWSQGYAERRGLISNNDSSISGSIQASAPTISEPVRAEAPVMQPSYDAGAAARDAQDRMDLDKASAAFDRTSAWLEGRGSRLW